jgi:hypothetical protein
LGSKKAAKATMVLGYWAILRQRRHGLTVEDSGDGLFPPILTGLAFDGLHETFVWMKREKEVYYFAL